MRDTDPPILIDSRKLDIHLELGAYALRWTGGWLQIDGPEKVTGGVRTAPVRG
jgi:hypothetical protein